MKRIDYRTVELTETEQKAKAQYEELLDRGFNVHEAVRHTRMNYAKRIKDESFWAWLID